MCNQERTMKAGYHEMIITPPLGYRIPGYFKIRPATGKITDLYLRAVAFDNGETRAVIFMCDALNVHGEGHKEVCRLLKETCGVDENCVYLHGTHSHTACYVSFSEKENSETSTYYSRLMGFFATCAKLAFDDLKPCSFKIARGTAKDVGFMRRYEMKDGSFRTNPPTGSTEILRRIGIQDEAVQLIRILRDGGKEILLVNFSTHPDVIGGTEFCWDWPGWVVEFLKNSFQGNIHALMLNGCQGNSNHCDRFLPKGTKLGGVDVAKRMARTITGEVLKIYDRAVAVEGCEIKGFKKNAIIGQHNDDYTEADIEIAKEIRKLYNRLADSNAPELVEYRKKYKISVPKAGRIVNNQTAPDFYEIPVSGLQIGSLAFIGIPGEPFCEIGLGIKENSKMDMTFVNCCTNGSFGYFPTEDAFAVEGYERDSSRFASNCANVLIETGLQILSEMQTKL